MTESEWFASSDASSMIEALWQTTGIERRWSEWNQRTLYIPDAILSETERFRDFQSKFHRYYLLCCRAIWDLLSQESSRYGVEVAERYLDGDAGWEELNHANFDAEGACFVIRYNTDPESIEQWIAEIRSIPGVKLASMLHPPETARQLDERELLDRAATFVDYAMIYPHISKGPPSEYFAPFLSAEILRTVFGNPFGVSAKVAPDLGARVRTIAE